MRNTRSTVKPLAPGTIALVLAYLAPHSAPAIDLEYRCVVVDAQTSVVQTDALPVGVENIPIGSTFYVELWTTDSGTVNTGLVSAYSDLSFTAGLATCEAVDHAALFPLFQSGMCAEGLVDELGASQLDPDIGVEPNWARVAAVEFTAADFGLAEFTLIPADTESSAYARGHIPTEGIGYGSCEVNVTPDPPVAGSNNYDRALEIIMPTSSAGVGTAYRLTLTSLYNPLDPQPTGPPDFSGEEGTVRYLNLLRDGNGDAVTNCVSSSAFNTTYPCAAVGCEPEFANWGALLGGVTAYLSGNAIVPDSAYTIAHLDASCAGNEATCTAVSVEVPFTTARYGDSQPDGAVNVTDVVNTVDVVKQVFSALFEYHVYVRNENPAPHNEAVNVTDVVLHVDALKLVAYPLNIAACP